MDNKICQTFFRGIKDPKLWGSISTSSWRTLWWSKMVTHPHVFCRLAFLFQQWPPLMYSLYVVRCMTVFTKLHACFYCVRWMSCTRHVVFVDILQTDIGFLVVMVSILSLSCYVGGRRGSIDFFISYLRQGSIDFFITYLRHSTTHCSPRMSSLAFLGSFFEHCGKLNKLSYRSIHYLRTFNFIHAFFWCVWYSRNKNSPSVRTIFKNVLILCLHVQHLILYNANGFIVNDTLSLSVWLEKLFAMDLKKMPWVTYFETGYVATSLGFPG